MLLSLAMIWALSWTCGLLFARIKIPKLVGMLFAGILLGPYVLDVLDPSLLGVSAELRRVALVIILTRAGLALNLEELKEVGRPAILLTFLPALLEILGIAFLASFFFKISLLEAVIMGTVVAAVSPAIIVPRMLDFMERGYGTKRRIPQMIMASASVDDVVVIVLFGVATRLAMSSTPASLHLWAIPSSIILGILGGLLLGFGFVWLFARIDADDATQTLVLLSFSFLLLFLEDRFTGSLAFSGLLAIMALGAYIGKKNQRQAQGLSKTYKDLWVGAEMVLFSLIGASLNLSYAFAAGKTALLVILAALCLRVLGVFLCLVKTQLNNKERLFTAFSYLPKATVQAAIGGLPLSMGLACGELVLTVAVVSIVFTAPLGAFLMDGSYQSLLVQEQQDGASCCHQSK